MELPHKDKKTHTMGKKIYFMRTESNKTSNTLKPLPFQKDENNCAIITDLKIQGNMEMRNEYPIGTVFASERLEIRNKNTGNMPFYQSGEIYPVSIDRSEIKAASHLPTDEMVTAYNDYLMQHPDTKEQGPKSGIFNEGNRPKELKLLDKLRYNPTFQVPTMETDGFWVDPNTWYDLVANIIENVNTLFKGPAGCGKTELIMLACKRMGLQCHIYDMGSMYDPISDLLGVHRMTATGSVFDYAQFTQDIQQEGVILLDELSRATPAVNNILMPCLDSRRTLRVEMAGAKDKREIPVHPRCRFIATANLGTEYVGANELDLALRDRFDEFEMSYMPQEEEMNLLIKRYKIAKADAQNIVSTATTIRSIAQRGEIEYSITTRETLRAAKKVSIGWDLKTAMERAFLPRYEGTRYDGSKSIVWNNIITR